MLRHERSAPIWLFSFVDLAFLLLIAFTQIGPDRAQSPDLVEIEIPRIYGRGTPLDGGPSAKTWQLRIHPAAISGESDAATPFELIEPGVARSDRAKGVIDADELASHLRLLHDRASVKPILVPHRDSRSQDLLVAVSLLEVVWQSPRTVAIRPGPAIASGPDHNGR